MSTLSTIRIRLVLAVYTSVCAFFSRQVVAQTDHPYHINGNASQENCNCYTITTDVVNQSGSVWNINKINLTQPFDYHFNIYMGCKDDNGADGIAFVLQPISTSIGIAGEGLGIQGVSPSVAIAIDTYQNGNLGDPAYDHLSIHLNGDLSHNSPNNIGPPVTALAGNNNIEDCAWHVLSISWDPSSAYLTVYMDNVERLKVATNLIQDVFNNDPMVYWGFTGSTGSLSNNQRFCTSLNASFSLDKNSSTCYPEPVILQDSSTSFGNIVKWFWDFGDGTTDTTANPPPHVYPQPGVYSVKLNIVGNNGCTSDTFQQKIVAGSKPLAGFDFKLPPYCDDKMIPFNDLSKVTYGTIEQWKWTVNGSGIVRNDADYYSYLPIGINNISLQVATKEGCISDIVSKSITIEPHPEISISGSLNACKNQEVRFMTFNENAAVPLQKAYWNFGDNNTGASFSIFHGYADTGVYTIRAYATAENGCLSDTLSRDIIIDGTYAKAGNDTIVAIGQPLQLQASGGKYYSWFPSSGLSDVSISNPVATSAGDITYTVTVSTDAGCATTDEIKIKAYKGPEFYVPNAFTPNGDGKNDVFRFTAVGMSDVYYFRVFNRYGQMLYSSKDSRQGWDGTLNGNPQSTDTYVWLIEGKDYMGNKIERKGTVTLMR
ncbi:MAG: gliding motility-associated C-terminal domain-containing protein [Chitinophagaceae bacterium]|nr:gliding motility-associated C-terminal domain-containing protein [Chitinophagaceae bacterium]